MKKIFIVLLCLSAVLIPQTVNAKGYSFDYSCDNKQDLGDGTFYMACHIAINSDIELNHIQGNLILENVTLQDIKTQSDWKSNNGLSVTVDFTSTTPHKGSFAVADLIFTGDNSLENCKANFEPIIAEKVTPSDPEPVEPKNPSCSIVDGEYYDKNGYKVTEENYYEDCFNYVCAIVDDKYYFNSQGKSVSYDLYVKDCSGEQYIPQSPDTGIKSGLIALPLGILSLIGIIKISKKNTKIYKI